MSATIASSAAPAWAIRIWADERSIYAELPSINGPYVAEFVRTEGGLSQALHTLGAMRPSESYGQPYVKPEVLPKKLQNDHVTSRDLDEARAVLKKLGVL